MVFTLLHTADWQIGKQFGSFDAEVQGVLRDARLGAIDRLAMAAEAAGARHVLVAGDVYEAETLPAKTVRQPLEKMRAHPSLSWHLLPGNHDPHRPGGLWEHLASSPLPANVGLMLAPDPIEIEAGIFVLPAPLRAKSTGSDPTAWMDRAETPTGALRIGLAHGSVRNFGHEGEAATPIAEDRALTARLDYLALGDWHGARQAGPRAWYSGTPEPDRFLDNDAGMALIVRLAGQGEAPAIERVSTARFSWHRLAVALDAGEPVAALEEALATLPAASDAMLLELRLSGAATPAGHGAIARRLAELEPRLRALDHDLDRLSIATGSGSLDWAESTGELRLVAERLQSMVAGGGPEAGKAGRALARLATLAAGAEQSRQGEP